MRYLIILAFLMCATPAPAEEYNCIKDRRVVGACYAVDGSITVGANMRPRINPAGTKRLLAIAERSETDTNYFWPQEIEEYLSTDNYIVGKFVVCPFTPDKPKVMRVVCIESARNIKVFNSGY